MFRSRASSPIAGVRKFFGRLVIRGVVISDNTFCRSRSTSKQPKEIIHESPISDNDKEIEKVKENEKMLILELEKTRIQLTEARNQLIAYQQKERIPKLHVASQSDPISISNVATMTSSEVASESSNDKENVAPDDVCSRIRILEEEINALKKESADKTEDFRRTRKDFILILKVLKKCFSSKF